MAKPVPSRGSDQFVVRFPEGMRDRIRQDAEFNSRSMNAEIVARLEEHPDLAAAINNSRSELAALSAQLEHSRSELKKCREQLEDYKTLLKFAEQKLEDSNQALARMRNPDGKPAKAKEPVRLTEEEKEELWEWMLQRAKQSK